MDNRTRKEIEALIRQAIKYVPRGKVVAGAVTPTSSAPLIPTNPPAADHPVENLFVDAITGNLEVRYDDAITGVAGICQSDPPTGDYRVTNLYVDSSNGRLTVEYDDTPAP